MSEPKTTDTMIAALLRERAGYVARGMDDRAAQVDEQLKARGYETAAPEDAKDAASEEQPKERRTPPRRTTKG